MANTLPVSNNRLVQLLASKPIILQLLKFAAIGALNTALDFIILNYVTKSLGITSGVELGFLNIISFSAAIIQSYLWNKAWTFAASSTSLLGNAFRLMLVGGLGFISFVLVFVGAAYSIVDTYYLFILIVFLIAEIILWFSFGLRLISNQGENVGKQFLGFLIVSFIGLLINSGIVVLASNWLAPALGHLINADTIKNVAKIMATGVSLIWNFVGYKLIVFKK